MADEAAAAAPPLEEEDTRAKDFYHLLHGFVEALSEVFPECTVLSSKVGMLGAFVDQGFAHTAAIAEWQSNMTPENLELLNKKDSRLFTEVFDKHPLLGDINFSEKWLDPDLDDESRETVWWYLSELAKKSKPPKKGDVKKKRKNMKKTRRVKNKSAEEEMAKIARRFAERYGIKVNEETGDVYFNYKKIMETDAVSDPDVIAMREHLGL